ncbi:MAG: secreted protein [Segetibacter sp.]|nr:secreted protein [Segetibacter sp.]
MKTFLILAFICSASLQSFGQQNSIIWNERQPLQWTDFAGEVNDSSSFDAESFAEVSYNYEFNGPKDFNFEVFASFNKNTSWCRKEYQTQSLLKHEQLHFDIAELYAKKLKEAFDNYQYSKNFSNEIHRIFNQKKLEYHLMQHKYDDETNHSLNKERQKDWEQFIYEELSEMKYKYNYVKK